MIKQNPFRYFKTSPEVIRLAVMMCVRFPLSLRNVEDLLHERLKTFFMNAASTFAMRRCVIGGIASVRCSQVKYVRNVFIPSRIIPTGDGTWKKYL
tara:strand:+ start:326 stop:613 length:288 start_codon:yes stop_codon:yes gene_type:complete